MSKLNYERNVLPLVRKLQPQFEAARNHKLSIKAVNTEYMVYQKVNSDSHDILCQGTLRECYCFFIRHGRILNIKDELTDIIME